MGSARFETGAAVVRIHVPGRSLPIGENRSGSQDHPSAATLGFHVIVGVAADSCHYSSADLGEAPRHGLVSDSRPRWGLLHRVDADRLPEVWPAFLSRVATLAVYVIESVSRCGLGIYDA